MFATPRSIFQVRRGRCLARSTIAMELAWFVRRDPGFLSSAICGMGGITQREMAALVKVPVVMLPRPCADFDGSPVGVGEGQGKEGGKGGLPGSGTG
jgi:hypothetical protein